MGSSLTKFFGPFKSSKIKEKDLPIPSEEDLQQARKIMNEKDKSLIEKMLDQTTKAWMKQELFCAVIGNTGTGKSSLINAIRNLSPMDEGAAPVNVIESTTEPTPYPHPNNKNLIFYDLPGVGTQNFPRETYLEDRDFKKYHFYFIVTSCRFTENDVWLAEHIQEAGKSFYFIRTKIDQDVRNQKRDYKQEEATVLKNVRDYTLSSLGKEGLPNQKVYLLSNHHRELFNFPKLMEDVLHDLPNDKKEAMALTIQGFSETIIMEKVKCLKRFVYHSAAALAVTAPAPTPGHLFGFNFPFIMAEIEHYRSVFGLRDEDFKRNRIPEEKLTLFKEIFTKEAVSKLYVSYSPLMTTEEVSRISRIVAGSELSVDVAASFYVSNDVLTDILNKISDVGLDLFRYHMEEKLKNMEI